ncbi:rhamnogalacturonan acetylesterase [Croceicoccus mobilis]|uniref:Lysophospholipase n=1 Tax=Croceicoccus mobilis TaxID=1703339 RepID=A0A916Z0N8_9SPHN|nr:rhamnogalacturonan acetylesterase [Croceicoccus mobilis]GGD70289.1 lysophospholipase [Croceicoccus mobilis]
MKRPLLFTAAAVTLPLFAAMTASAQAGPPQAEMATETSTVEGVNKIILVGDSTTATGNGWGPMFCAHHTTHPTACLNLARNGRSSGSYRAEGLWDVALNEMKVAGYGTVFVLIGFGHNDQPGKPGRSTDLKSEFPANMRRYVREAREAGAVPVLFTPLTRRLFRDGEVERDLDPWAEAIRQIAAETDTPLVDLNGRSTQIVQAMGPSVQNLLAEIPAPPQVAAAAAIDGETLPSATGRPTPAPVPDTLRVAKMTWVYDYTHLGEFGGKLFAAVMADELASEVPEMRRLLRP